MGLGGGQRRSGLAEEANEKRLHAALEKLLSDPRYTRRAKEWAAIFARYDSGAMFRKFLSEVLPRSAPA